MQPSGRRVLPGQPQPLGATVQPGGVNFAVYSRFAERVEVCSFDSAHGPETGRVELPLRTGYVWHGFVPDLRPGQLYGLRVHGPYEPHAGLRFNAAKLLIDPYARALAGRLDWRAPLQGSLPDGGPDKRDDAFGVPKNVVYEDSFDWQGDAPPAVPWHETVIYEAHVKGFSVRHPGVEPELRGTYLGLASDAGIAHLQRLAVTAVELLPVHAHGDSRRLSQQGLTNYWGYDSIGFFAPDARFASRREPGSEVVEFKEMVRRLHRAGIEVILDVVYNHTAEGDENGPTISLRGIDNPTYYRLDPADASGYLNLTGTGNTINTREPQTLRMIMDSLRYWVQEMHVDGFRFDLAAALARDHVDEEAPSSFLDAVYQDPIVSRVKLIAEPWHLGPGGYQAGRFPAPWTEWNDRFRDDVRSYWRGDESETPDLAYRLTGSMDLYGFGARSPQASINYVTAHDGFTLADLVSYTKKRNLANGESNRDGRDEIAWNCGVEGPSEDPDVVALRERQQRNLLATLLFSQGVPMLLGGDELGRTQFGNNNAYAQDNATTWYRWDLSPAQKDLLRFTSRLISIRKRHANLRRRNFLHGRAIRGSGMKDVVWLRADGGEMTDADWRAPWLKCFGLRLDGELGEMDEEGRAVVDDSLLLILNASDIALQFRLPPGPWSLTVDTGRPEVEENAERYRGGENFRIGERSLALLAQQTRNELTQTST